MPAIIQMTLGWPRPIAELSPTLSHSLCRIACAITILSPGVIKIRVFLVYEITAVLEGVIMWEGNMRP